MNGKEFSEIIRSRRSIRRFDGREVPPELIAYIIDTAASAPSAGGRNDREFIAVTSSKIKNEMLVATKEAWDDALKNCDTDAILDALSEYRGNFEWFAEAPVVVAVTCKKIPLFMSQMFKEKARTITGSAASALMAAENLLLAAHSSGLAGCCLTGPLAAADKLAALIKTDRRHEIVCLVALGYGIYDTTEAPERSKAKMRIL